MPSLVPGQYKRSELDSLKQKICEKGSQDPTDDALPLNALNNRYLGQSLDLKKAIELIFKGEVGIFHSSTSGLKLGDMLVSPSELRKATSKGPEIYFNTVEAAQILRCKQQTVSAWCRVGLLKTECFEGRTKLKISPESLAIFQSKYIQVSSLANELGSSSKSLASEFKQMGIKLEGEWKDGNTKRGALVSAASLAETLLSFKRRLSVKNLASS
jgi:hypothetical protein